MPVDINQVAMLIAEKVREIATRQGNVPFLTGDLRKSVISRSLGGGRAVITSNLPYARAVHDGRPAITIRPKKKGGILAWRKDGKRGPLPKGKAFSAAVKSGEVIVARKVHQKARAGRPFITDAARQVEKQGYDFLEPMLARTIGADLAKAVAGALKMRKL